MITIYLIFNSKTRKGYLGQAISFSRRWVNHLSSARRGSRLPIHCAIRKYGAAAFELYEIGVCTSKDQANRLERQLILSLRRHAAGCYNASGGGEGMWNPTPQTRKRLRLAMQRRNISNPDWRKQLSATRLRLSKVSNEKVKELFLSGQSAAAIAKQFGLSTPAICNRLHKLGFTLPSNKAYITGRPLSREHIEKVRAGLKRHWNSMKSNKEGEASCHQQPEKMFQIKL